ncbi:RraA family protein [Tenggerimyces flavus]|uniref:Putative 4-hydroxy-4-methyl-2-oxoglutarate aldolase n=1 Tax=Tenggerimyces flavus TaxID=1708749 RepID=A0ABV7YLR0_9ACTN|nr:RraA family protein [Tenggerimyces flavus]MBM7786188.1 regulator of RNase E activity RraA [Tenggerimyces flavus]
MAGSNPTPDAMELSSALICDALDELGLPVQLMDDAIRPLALDTVICGPVLTVEVQSSSEVTAPDVPYANEILAVDALQPGSVSVYAVPADNRAAVWGELFSHAALARGAAGAIVDGYVRDTRQLREMKYPVFCRGASPLDTRARARVREIGSPVQAGGVQVHTGDFVVADSDGVVVVPASAMADVRQLVLHRVRRESGARHELRNGRSLDAVWDKWRVL